MTGKHKKEGKNAHKPCAMFLANLLANNALNASIMYNETQDSFSGSHFIASLWCK